MILVSPDLDDLENSRSRRDGISSLSSRCRWGITNSRAVKTASQPSRLVLELATSLSERLQTANVDQINILAFHELHSSNVHADTVCISLLEVEEELLASLNPQAMDLLRLVTDKVRDLIWLTGADMLSDNPQVDLTLSPGLSRSLMMEQPSLNFVILDIGRLGPDSTTDMQRTCDNVERLLTCTQDFEDKEYIQHKGILHVSRLGPDLAVNSMFRRRLRLENPVQPLSLAAAEPVKLAIGRPGSADTIFFEQMRESPTKIAPGFIDVAVKAVSLNAKDVYAIHGIIETRTGTLSLEFTGTVSKVASDVKHLVPGDKVLVCMPNNFATTQRVPVWQAHKLQPGEDHREIATLLGTNGSALYALRNLAHLRRGESILIHSGAGAFGIAAIAIAQRIGAVVYTTAGSPSRQDYLMEHAGRYRNNLWLISCV